MKKLAMGVLCAGALAIAGALGTSYYTGGRIQQAFEQTADTWSSEDGFAVRVLEYQRGLVTAHAQTLWSFADAENTYDIVVTHDIVHGPWPLGRAGKVVSRFVLPEDSEPELVEALQDRAPLEWVTLVGWQGNTTHAMTSPHFTAHFADGSTLTWGGLKADWTLSAEQHAAQGQVRMPVLRLKSEDGSRMDLEDAELAFDSRIPEGHSFWDGPASFKLGLLSVLNPGDDSAFKIQQLQMDSTTRLQDQSVDMGLDTRMAKLETPTYSASELVASVQLKRIDATWLDEWMRWAQGNGAAEDQGIALLRSLPTLLAGKPEFAITRLGMQTPDGPAELSARLAYVGQQPEAFNPATDIEGQFKALLPQPMLVQLLDAKVRSDYLTLLEQLGQEMSEEQLQAAVNDGVVKRMKTLLSQGVVEKRGDALEATLEFSQGSFKLNGRPQPLQHLLGIGGAL